MPRLPKWASIAIWITACAFGVGIIIKVLLVFSHRLNTAISDPVQFVSGNLVNALIFVAIVFQALIYRQQREIMEEQRKLTETGARVATETVIYSQRAYIAAIVENVTGDKLHITVENAGHTPANDVWLAFTMRYMPEGNEIGQGEHEVETDAGFGPSVYMGALAPGRGGYEDVYYGGSALENRQQYEARELRLYCWGWVYYRDLFEQCRHTEFAFWHVFGETKATPCKTGNKI